MVIKLKSVLFPCFKAMLFCECSLQLCSLGVDESGHKQFGFSRTIVWLKPLQLIIIFHPCLSWWTLQLIAV